ncbi:uncharacterized protein LOC125859057 [Solanum stenotomum]|uniref:uncharacterized protein LOC125859057 n=1 Tax=Solanum stenotomum TaxID=172797 RepID=UPI0020D0EEFC|nr:uncharacterized protein LOC125859057 [Solanum stenotomum]
MDYSKLNKWTLRDHFPMPFMDQMLDRLASKGWYCFLDGYSGYNQQSIAPKDQEKTTFACPYGTFAFKRMPFGLCNAPATFQRCMMSIFSDMVEDTLEGFTERFEESNLVLNWEKCHFMVKEGIALGHKVSQKGIEVDKSKIKVIKELPPPICVKGVRSFLGHTRFYRRFIKDFSKIAHPMCKILEKGVKFVFDGACLKAFECLKEKLISALVIIGPDWAEPFEVMCDASGTALGVVLGHKCNKMFFSTYYASKTLNGAQRNYIVTAQELLKSSELICWALRRGCENQVADHLSRLEAAKKEELELERDDTFPDEQVLAATLDLIPWFSDYANFLVSDLMSEGLTYSKGKAKILHILEACHSSPVGGHDGGARTAHKILQCGYYWPTIHQDAVDIVRSCDVYQRQGAISQCHELPMTPILEVDLLNVWGIDFMGPFVISYGKKYILVVVDYVSKWVEVVTLPKNDGKSVVGFCKRTSSQGLEHLEPLSVMVGLTSATRLRLFLGKPRSKWSGPFKVTQVFQSSVIELENDKGERFKANGQRIKAYMGVPDDVNIVEECKLDEV